MSAHMRKHHTEANNPNIIRMTYRNNVYEIPWNVAEKYKIKKTKQRDTSVLADEVFADLDRKYTKAGTILKGLRYREDLSQIDFAKKIKVTQSDLSKMENGKRPIGKIVARRIEAKFGVDYRSFLE